MTICSGTKILFIEKGRVLSHTHYKRQFNWIHIWSPHGLAVLVSAAPKLILPQAFLCQEDAVSSIGNTGRRNQSWTSHCIWASDQKLYAVIGVAFVLYHCHGNPSFIMTASNIPPLHWDCPENSTHKRARNLDRALAFYYPGNALTWKMIIYKVS